jgi:tetratricopeptide repeat protein 30
MKMFQMTKLQAAIKYGEEDLAGAKSLVDQCPSDDPDTDINRGQFISIFLRIKK